MACFGGPTYHEIAIEKELFLPIILNIAQKSLRFLGTTENIYESIAAPLKQDGKLIALYL